MAVVTMDIKKMVESEYPRYFIGKIGISALNMNVAVENVLARINASSPGYICVSNVRTVVLAQKDPEFCKIQNSSFMTVPDGMPLVWYAHMGNLDYVGKVSGPDLMDNILSISIEYNLSHYFYGSTIDVLSKMNRNLKNRFNGICIKGMHSPPFRPLRPEEKQMVLDEINRTKPSIVWVGLGAPKQEYWMYEMIDKIDSALLIGVGAAFIFAADEVKRPHPFIRNMGLEWLFRCIQQPITARRFIYPFFYFNGMLMKQFWRHVWRDRLGWRCHTQGRNGDR